jgi:hypothetical protein
MKRDDTGSPRTCPIALQGGGRGFESRRPLEEISSLTCVLFDTATERAFPQDPRPITSIHPL